jgi:hypothetical protein
VKKLPTICLNNREVIIDLNNITGPPQGCILCADVQDMYPSIPIDYGISAIKNVMIQHNFFIDQLEFFLELLEWTLLNNYFKFYDKIFLQIKGTAMGTPISECYANIPLYHLEQSCLTITNPI